MSAFTCSRCGKPRCDDTHGYRRTLTGEVCDTCPAPTLAEVLEALEGYELSWDGLTWYLPRQVYHAMPPDWLDAEVWGTKNKLTIAGPVREETWQVRPR